MKDLSIKEAQALVLAASRGSYQSWGLAEETAAAAGWLLCRGILCIPPLVGLLTRFEGKRNELLGPVSIEQTWRASDGELCPIATGALISDLASTFHAQTSFELEHTAYPMFLLPSASTASDKTGFLVNVEWGDITVAVNRQGLKIEGNKQALEQYSASHVTVTISEKTMNLPPFESPARVQLTDQDVSRLSDYLAKTYVPETEQSKLSGAGGARVDD